MFDPHPLFFNLYMGPNFFHDRWAPRCVVCSTLICGSKFVPLQVDYRCVVCSLFGIIKENNRVFAIIPWCDVEARKDVRESVDRARGKSIGGCARVATVFGVVVGRMLRKYNLNPLE